jgi:hypothetical protein
MSMTPSLLKRLSSRRSALGPAVYAAVLSLVVLSLAGAAGLVLHLPWLFPSLGPTVMLFFESPEQPSSGPVNTLAGHLTGLAVQRRCRAVVGESMRLPRPGLWPRMRFRADHGGVCHGGRRSVCGAVVEPVG